MTKNVCNEGRLYWAARLRLGPGQDMTRGPTQTGKLHPREPRARWCLSQRAKGTVVSDEPCPVLETHRGRDREEKERGERERDRDIEREREKERERERE